MQDAISRVQTLEEEGRVTGVMDDRGKFIYISSEEMAAVAGYIRNKGRVAIGELSAMSNTFIDLQQRSGSAQQLMFLPCAWQGRYAAVWCAPIDIVGCASNRETAQGALLDMDLDLGDLKELDKQPPAVSVGA